MLFIVYYSYLGGKQWQTTSKNFPRMQCAKAIPVTWLGSGSCQARPSRLNTNEWMNSYFNLIFLLLLLNDDVFWCHLCAVIVCVSPHHIKHTCTQGFKCLTRWHLLKSVRIWSIGMKSSFGGISLRNPNIFCRVKITVWG